MAEGLRRFVWQECQFDGESVTVRGVLRDPEIGEHFIIDANGGEFEVVLTDCEQPGSKVRMIDVASFERRYYSSSESSDSGARLR